MVSWVLSLHRKKNSSVVVSIETACEVPWGLIAEAKLCLLSFDLEHFLHHQAKQEQVPRALARKGHVTLGVLVL